MAFKQFDLDGVGAVTIYKRRGTRSVRLSVSHNGQVKISMPTWLPYRAGLSYADSKRQWLEQQLSLRQTKLLQPGQAIGQHHHLFFEPIPGIAIHGRLTGKGDIIVQHPAGALPSNPAVQQVAEKACIRALRREAEDSLPERLHALSDCYALPYNTFGVRQLKGRWGSCDQRRHITINLFAMQLPDTLIDYVLLHELAHTKYLNHSPQFWKLLLQLDRDAKEHRRQLRAFRPVVA